MSDVIEKVWRALNGWSGVAASERATRAVIEDMREWAQVEFDAFNHKRHQEFLRSVNGYAKSRGIE